MKLKINKSIFLIFIFFLFLPQNNCANRTEQFKLYRFIDHINRKNVIESPLKDLPQRFDKHEQELKNWLFLAELSRLRSFSVYAASTEFPVLGHDDSKKPEGMRLLKNGKQINFSENFKEDKESWRWVKIEDVIISDKELHYLEDVIIEKLLLPGGEILFEIDARSGSPAYFCRLKIEIDGKIIGEIPVRERKTYRIFGQTNLGIQKLRFSISKAEKFTEIQDKFLIVNQIKIKGLNDIILISVKNKKNKENLTGVYKVSYYVEPLSKLAEDKSAGLGLGIENPVLKYYYSLYEIYNNYNLKIGKNPFHVKKKLKIGVYSLNSLFAPPLSIFMFEFKVPKNKPKLDFGCGIFPAFSEQQKGVVNFKIIVEDEKGSLKVLFSRNIDSSEINPQEIVHNRIDLASYSRKNIKLSFVTESIFSENKKKESHSNNNYSFWYNPVIYSPSEEPREINVILISLDTLRADHLGCYGYFRDTSPNIDRFVGEGVLFLNTFSQAPWTLPSHISMLTSLNLINHQVYEHTDKLNYEVPTLAEVLRKYDYFTNAFTGGVLVSSKYGFSKGFDMYYEDYPNDTPENLYQKTEDWINRNKEKKFFLFLHTYQPHDPYSNDNPNGKTFIDKESKWKKIDILKLLRGVQSDKPIKFRPLPENEKKNIVALYDGEIRYTDECLIKPLVAELKRLNLYERTMIIITSDHGEEFYEHKKWVHGEHLYNELIKVPLIIKFPYSKYRGERIVNNTSSIDIVPTILEELKIDYSNFEFDGKSLIKIIKGKERDERISIAAETRFHESAWRFPKISVLSGSHKLILTRKEAIERVDESAILKRQRKIEIYNIKKDPFERNNLVNTEEDMARDLIQVLYKNYFNKGEKRKLGTVEIKIDKELKERLKALGYIR